MPQPHPYSLRVGDERMARIDAFGETFGLTRHAAIIRLIDNGLQQMEARVPVGPPPTNPRLSAAEAGPVSVEIRAGARAQVPLGPLGVPIAPLHPSVPLYDAPKFNPRPKK